MLKGFYGVAGNVLMAVAFGFAGYHVQGANPMVLYVWGPLAAGAATGLVAVGKRLLVSS